eukprot:358574-Chlamydomonas_euryale.AAC.3
MHSPNTLQHVPGAAARHRRIQQLPQNLALPPFHTCRRPRHQPNGSRHRHHLRFRLEPTPGLAGVAPAGCEPTDRRRLSWDTDSKATIVCVP